MILKVYEQANFEEAWATYLPANSAATPLQAATAAGANGVGDPRDTSCSGGRIEEIVAPVLPCSGVAANLGGE